MTAPGQSFSRTAAPGFGDAGEGASPNPIAEAATSAEEECDLEVLGNLGARPDPGLDAGVPRARVRTESGRWGIVHASRVSSPGATFAVIIEEATPTEIASLIAEALGLTPREREITQEVVQGRSSREIAASLSISANTVQDHLKSIFDKTGVRSRRELVASMMMNHYVPHIAAGQPVETRGYFRF